MSATKVIGPEVDESLQWGAPAEPGIFLGLTHDVPIEIDARQRIPGGRMERMLLSRYRDGGWCLLRLVGAPRMAGDVGFTALLPSAGADRQAYLASISSWDTVAFAAAIESAIREIEM